MKAKALLFLAAAAIVLAGWWIYSPAFHGGWLWDDNTNITENSLMRDPAALWKIWFAPQSLDYYPLQMSVEWIQWRWWGMDTFGYHLTNVCMQVLNGFLLWRVLRKLGLRFAWLGGLLLVVHPMTVESVAWIVEVKNTMSLAFLLLAFDAWIDWDARATPALLWYGLSLLYFLAAMLSKASVVMFPVILLLHAWWRRGRVARRDLVASLPFFAVSLGLGVAALWLQRHRAMAALVVPMGGPFSRVAVEGLAAAFYFWKFVMPVGLMPIYPRWDVDPPSAAQFLPWLVIGGLAWLLWKTGRRGVLFGLGVFLVDLIPVSGLFTVSFMRLTWVMDHLAYVPLVGLIGLAVAGLGAVFEGAPENRRAQIRIVSWVVVSAIVAALAFESHAYARTFSSGRAYWTSAVERNPGAWAARYNLALILVEAGEFPEAIAHLEQAVRLDPDYTEAHVNLANALSQTGRYAEAIPHFERALQLDPANAVTHYNFGLALRALGRRDEARSQLLEAAELARH